MKKTYFLLFYLLAFSLSAYAQVTPTSVLPDPYQARMNYIFNSIDKSQIMTGSLLDYGAEFAEVSNYNGRLAENNIVDMITWRSIYGTIYSGKINSRYTKPTIDRVNKTIESFSSAQPITIPILHLRYNTLSPDAVTKNLLRVSNDQLFDVAGRAQSPYLTKSSFAACPVKSFSEKGQETFILRPELYIINIGKNHSSSEVDFGDGKGYRTVAWNTPVSVSYTTAGEKTIKVKIRYKDNTVFETHSKFFVLEVTTALRYAPENLDIIEDPFRANANHSGGRLFIRYSDEGEGPGEL